MNWIPINERKPNEGDAVLIWHKHLHGDGAGPLLMTSWHDSMTRVTHWMPITPPVPDEERRVLDPITREWLDPDEDEAWRDL